MLTIISGLPGAGKTLLTISEIDQEYTGKRPIYYYGIKELNLEGWTELQDPQLWPDLPDGSIVVIDEAQGPWPARGNRQDKPGAISAVETHRHQGFDLFFITQNPKLLDHNLRRLAGRHIHYWRPFGIQKTTRWEWQSCVDPDDYFAKKAAISKKVVKFPTKYYDAYHSAEVHTHKRKLPKKLLLIPGLLAVIIICGFAANEFLFKAVEKSKILASTTTAMQQEKNIKTLTPSFLGKITGEIKSNFRRFYIITRNSDEASRYIDGNKCYDDGFGISCRLHGITYRKTEWFDDRGQTVYRSQQDDYNSDDETIQGIPN